MYIRDEVHFYWSTTITAHKPVLNSEYVLISKCTNAWVQYSVSNAESVAMFVVR